MNNIVRHLAVSVALTAVTFGLSAQELSTEVEIRYEEAPELQNFDKLTLNPSLRLSTQKASALSYSTRNLHVGVPGSISTLEPASYADTIYSSPFRGYAALGFMTKYNLAASAGYKIFDTDHTRLNAWFQFDGSAYRTQPMDAVRNAMITDGSSQIIMENVSRPKHYVRNNTASVGANLHQAVGKESFIDAGMDYSFSRYNILYESQNLHRFNLEASWSLSHGGFNYGLGAGYHHFGFSNIQGYGADFSHAQRENRITAGGFFYGSFAGASSAGINIEMSHLSYPYDGSVTYVDSDDRYLPGFSHTLLSLTPYYRFDIKNFHLDLGARIDMTFNDGKFFHIAPHAQATWTPGGFAKLYIKAGGGEWQNTLSSLYEVSHYMLPFKSYHNSHIPVTAEVGVTVGDWKGFYAEISATYALANDWLMPDNSEGTNFCPIDIKGYKLRGAVGYRYRDIIDFRASYERAPQKYTHAYYLWRDRAKSVVNIDLLVRPMKDLDLNIGWEYRGGRRCYVDAADETTPAPVFYKMPLSLRSVNNFKAGALYRITPQWSVFLTGENLLNRHYFLVSGEGAQGITGLLGATYKF